MLAIARFRVPLGHVEEFKADISRAREALATCDGYIDGAIGQNLDDSGLWVLTTTWLNVGSYRRALSSIVVKMQAVPLLARAIDEPGAFELLASE
jgi:hypothetical protein